MFWLQKPLFGWETTVYVNQCQAQAFVAREWHLAAMKVSRFPFGPMTSGSQDGRKTRRRAVACFRSCDASLSISVAGQHRNASSPILAKLHFRRQLAPPKLLPATLALTEPKVRNHFCCSLTRPSVGYVCRVEMWWTDATSEVLHQNSWDVRDSQLGFSGVAPLAGGTRRGRGEIYITDLT